MNFHKNKPKVLTIEVTQKLMEVQKILAGSIIEEEEEEEEMKKTRMMKKKQIHAHIKRDRLYSHRCFDMYLL